MGGEGVDDGSFQRRKDGNGLRKNKELVLAGASTSPLIVPAMIAELGENATLRFIDFFTAHIRNPNTRAARNGSTRTLSGAMEKCSP